MRRSALFLLSLSIICAASAQDVLNSAPPLGFPAEKGIVAYNEGKTRAMGVTPADLLCPVPDVNAIPGYTVVFPDDQTTSSSPIPLGHTCVHLYVCDGMSTKGNVLLVHPKQVVAPMPVPNLLLDGKPFSSAKAASLNGVVVVPVSALEPFGVSIIQNRTSNLWTATLQKGTRTVQVQACSREAQTDSGKVNLERAVFPFGDQLVVPLRQIAESLGMEVQAQ